MAHGTARIGEDRYRTEIEVGPHHLVADEPPALGGQAVGPAPYDLLLASLGACTAITLRMYADRKGWPLLSVEVGLRLLGGAGAMTIDRTLRSEEHTSELQSLMRTSYAVFCLKQKIQLNDRYQNK